MKDSLAQLGNLLAGKVRLLLADDDPAIIRSLRSLFSSPVFEINSAASFAEAEKLLRDPSKRWHGWLLDIDLGQGRTGLDIMKLNEGFPFVIILSGLRSMTLAGSAIRQGAMMVFDKSGSLKELHDQTCRTAALGYILDGKPSQYLPIFKLLCQSTITTPEEWAEKACIGDRQLRRICDLHPIGATRVTLAFYYSIYCLLWKGAAPFDDTLPPAIKEKDAAFLKECCAYTLKKLAP
jgi:hypothetical protein